VRVLVVDDDEAVRSALTHALRRDGYDVSTAADGATALAWLLRLRYDAVVLDILMPEPNGLEVCRAIRARGDDTPILMLTARDLVSDRVAGLDAGADDYLAKPFALEELRARAAPRARTCRGGYRRGDGAAGRGPGAAPGRPADRSRRADQGHRRPQHADPDARP
jgi:DNA-binding response OmpR family regulator